TVYYSGHLSDLLGRMRTLGLSGYAIAVALFLYSSANDIGLSLMMASAFIGFGWGLMYTLAPVVLTRICSAERRVQIFSLYAVFLMSGFGLSPVFASWMTSNGHSITAAFQVIAVLCAISGTLFLLLKGPVNHHAVAEAPNARSRLSPGSVWAILQSRAWLPVVMVYLGASVFAGLNNFQTSIARAEGLNYADYFLTYTITTVICRFLFAGLSGGKSPYRLIGILQTIMCLSALLFLFINGNQSTYIACAILFGIGYGASYPILAAMAANDAQEDLLPQTLQLFSLTYFIGIFGFPYVAGWLIVDFSISVLIMVVALLAAIEAAMALVRSAKN
ncbi:MAG: MFS transporter, partial [Pseudomonadota bacterium]